MKRKQVMGGTVLILLVVILNACYPTYVANTTNIPLLSGKGEFNANIVTGTSDVEPQFSFAVTNHIGLMANGSFSYFDSETNYPKRNFFEGAIGYYNSPSKYQIMEVYGGYGKGFVSSNYNIIQSSDRFDANYQRWFIQPNLGFRSRFLEGGLSLRFSYLDIDKTLTDKIISAQNFYFEPTATIRGGFENFKVSLQFGISKLIGGFDDNFDHQPFIFGLGLHFNLGGKRMPEIE